MKDYKYRPLDGLLVIKKEEISNADILSVVTYSEEKIKSSPSGRVAQLALLFYCLKILIDTGIPFYVKGGIIQHFYLKEECRPTYDLDIIIPSDSDILIKELEERLNALHDTLSFVVKKYRKNPPHEGYFYETFNAEITIKNGEEDFSKMSIDGIINPSIFNSISPLEYEIPEIIAPNLTFKGVPIEYVLAEKITAITNELARPYKHLVDVYSLIKLDINIPLLKKYLQMILNNDNEVRSKLNNESTHYVYQIKEDKEFVGSYLFTALQAGYVVSLKEMIDTVNKWLTNNIEK